MKGVDVFFPPRDPTILVDPRSLEEVNVVAVRNHKCRKRCRAVPFLFVAVRVFFLVLEGLLMTEVGYVCWANGSAMFHKHVKIIFLRYGSKSISGATDARFFQDSLFTAALSNQIPFGCQNMNMLRFIGVTWYPDLPFQTPWSVWCLLFA